MTIITYKSPFPCKQVKHICKNRKKKKRYRLH